MIFKKEIYTFMTIFKRSFKDSLQLWDDPVQLRI